MKVTWLTPEEAAERIRVTPDELRRYMDTDQFVFARLPGEVIRIERASFERFIRVHRNDFEIAWAVPRGAGDIE